MELQIAVKFGYRSTDFISLDFLRKQFPDSDNKANLSGMNSGEATPFLFINIGMFAVLHSLHSSVTAGTVYQPITSIPFDRSPARVGCSHRRAFTTPPNSLVPGIPLCLLVGLGDELPFVTPQHYSLEELLGAAATVSCIES